MITFYGYDKCGTCRKAEAILKSRGIAYTKIDVTTHPPPAALLKAILKAGDYKLGDLFNRSGEQYRQLNMKDKLKAMSEADAVALLAKNGRLVKRPIVTDGKNATVGFDEDTFAEKWE